MRWFQPWVLVAMSFAFVVELVGDFPGFVFIELSECSLVHSGPFGGFAFVEVWLDGWWRGWW